MYTLLLLVVTCFVLGVIYAVVCKLIGKKVYYTDPRQEEDFNVIFR